MSFNKGDRVRYTGKSRHYSDAAAIGAEGTVEYYNSRDDVTVEWDTPGRHGRPGHHVYAANLALVKPAFKAGDRVRGNNFRDGRKDGVREGVIIGATVGTEVTLLRLGDGRTGYVFTATLEAAPELADWEKELLKPVLPAVGSKVRVTHEGVVDEVGGLGFRIRTEDNGLVYFGKASRTFEVLEPAPEPEPEPYAEGTLVKLLAGKAVRTNRKDVWFWTQDGDKSLVLNDADIRERVAKGQRAEILYDPAAQS